MRNRLIKHSKTANYDAIFIKGKKESNKTKWFVNCWKKKVIETSSKIKTEMGLNSHIIGQGMETIIFSDEKKLIVTTQWL